MIKLIDNGPEDSLIEFRPRFKTRGKLITRQLVYGHRCPWCGNVIQAMFITPDEVKLYDYEETRVISQGDKNDGELLKIVPNQSDKTSAYRVDMYRTKTGTGQLIRLKNHLLRWEGYANGGYDQLFEVGERCCRYVGLYTRNEAEAVNELAMACGYDHKAYLKAKVYVPLSYMLEWKPKFSWSVLDCKLVPAIGKGNTMIMIARSALRGPYTISSFIDLYETWCKENAPGIKTTVEVDF